MFVMADTTCMTASAIEPLILAETAAVARRWATKPRVAFLSYSTVGNPLGQQSGTRCRRSRDPRDETRVDFGISRAGWRARRGVKPQCREELSILPPLWPSGRCRCLPGRNRQNLSAKLLRELGGDSVMAWMLVGSGEAGTGGGDDGVERQ